ncbi:hypothetical protein HY837_06620 [archaeon]|nr:hypothetical protein [archaeon]
MQDFYLGESDNIYFSPEDLQGDDWQSVERRWMLDQIRSESLGFANRSASDDYSGSNETTDGSENKLTEEDFNKLLDWMYENNPEDCDLKEDN